MTEQNGRSMAQALWLEMASTIPPYPRAVVPVPEPIVGTAFFPGGLGLWLDEDDGVQQFPKEVMVVGQDFNTVTTYQIAHGWERKSAAVRRGEICGRSSQS